MLNKIYKLSKNKKFRIAYIVLCAIVWCGVIGAFAAKTNQSKSAQLTTPATQAVKVDPTETTPTAGQAQEGVVSQSENLTKHNTKATQSSNSDIAKAQDYQRQANEAAAAAAESSRKAAELDRCINLKSQLYSNYQSTRTSLRGQRDAIVTRALNDTSYSREHNQEVMRNADIAYNNGINEAWQNYLSGVTQQNCPEQNTTPPSNYPV